MPIHDWTRVSAGTFHAFHLAWIAELQRTSNGGLLPDRYYALAEQVAGRTAPDVLTLQDLRPLMADEGFGAAGPGAPPTPAPAGRDAGGGIATADAPAQASVVVSIPEATILALKRRRIVIRHATDDRVVALVEIVLPGNKGGPGPMQALVDKVVAAVQQGYHVLLVDLFPPGPSDPDGLHDRVWREMDGGAFVPPPNRPLTVAAYRAAGGVTAYVEPVAVGMELPPMPLFLDPDRYVAVPLEATSCSAYEGLPRRWKRVIEGIE